MNDAKWSEVDNYITNHLIGDDPVQRQVLERNREAGLPPIDVSTPQGRMLELLIKGVGGKNVLEIGTLGGFSTIWLARGLSEDGRVVSLELEPEYAKVARENIASAGVLPSVEVKIGQAADSLAELAESGSHFDFAFVDADKENYPVYLDWCCRLVRSGGMIVFDNVVREGEILNPQSADPKVPGTRQLYEKIAGRDDVEATAIQTVGEKHWDGFLLAIVK
ncbi:O-methyltransferase [Alterisphingorhabdus coralli]|uniref:O-methyltransferase n=1 Tax=Alterisphingorhabdus coralli TaxID=3071408 RepID=A0AA97F5N9_9SPHN|nr:O-methyltransferase [Parasphingorhabdus sp. SCSIO 66989]WOE73911.1 O-methyltransferase [Parasphingorhabdus sp. SCSIO 66989]